MANTFLKGDRYVNKEAILAELASHLWLIDEAWLNTIIPIIKSGDFESFFGMDDEDDAPKEHYTIRDRKAIFALNGPIFPQPNFLTRYLGIGVALSEFNVGIRDAVASDDIDEIILNANTPGGVVTGVSEASNLIAQANSEKKVTTFVSGSCCSAGYWIASGSDSIKTSDTGVIGSIGVVVELYAPKDEEDDYITITNTDSPNKRTDPRSKEGRAEIQKTVDAIAEVFIETVAVNRDVTEATVTDDFGKGGVLVGKYAVQAGLADSVGTFDDLFATTLIKGEESMPLTLKSFKDEHKDIHAQVMEEVKAGFDAQLTEKDAKIASLEVDLEASKEDAAGVSTRLDALEKARERDSLLQKEKAIKGSADDIFTKKLESSSVPSRMHAKVRKHVDYNAYVTDGALDTKAFTAAIDTELKEWESTFGESVQGFSTNGRSDNDEADEQASSIATRMAESIGIKATA